MTATVTPIHARRAGHAVSEGTASARRINRPAHCASLTPDPLLLHRVDASQLQTPVRMVHGPAEQRQCRPGMCEGLPTCGDHACQGHPGNDVPESERDGPLLLKVVLAYGATLALCGWATWQWLSR